jgi:putative transposase
MDFFTTPTFTFQVLYCFFVIEHERRRILHFNVTRHPSSTSYGPEIQFASNNADDGRLPIRS